MNKPDIKEVTGILNAFVRWHRHHSDNDGFCDPITGEAYVFDDIEETIKDNDNE